MRQTTEAETDSCLFQLEKLRDFLGASGNTTPPSAQSERQGELMAMCLEMAMEAVNRRGVREVEREMELADVLKMDLSGDSVAINKVSWI